MSLDLEELQRKANFEKRYPGLSKKLLDYWSKPENYKRLMNGGTDRDN